MVLESCMILLDNSEYMRNGDYVPTRLEAQHDAANLLVGAKTQSNPESTVGVIAMTGEVDGGGAELLISPTDDMGKILGALHGVPIRSNSNGGSNGHKSKKPKKAPGSALDGTDITGAIQVASLALKHRRNKNGAQRVVVFVGSPLTCDARALTKTGRQLKKNNVAIDVICLGELEANEPILKELVDAANGSSAGSGSGGETLCHLVTIPAGVLPSDVLVTSPIVHPGGPPGGAAGTGGGDGFGGSGGSGAGGAAAFAEYGGVDPNMDPELAMALRVSMEEERARQERVAAAAAAAAAEEVKTGDNESGDGGESKVEEANEEGAATTTSAGEGGGNASAMTVESSGADEDALLQQALAMSMQEDHMPPTAVPPPASNAAAVAPETMETDEDDAAMQLALQMSMQPDTGDAESKQVDGKEGDTAEKSGESATTTTGTGGQFQDQQFVNQLLGSLPGVDPSDPAIQEALRNLQQGQGSDEKEKDGKDDPGKKEED